MAKLEKYSSPFRWGVKNVTNGPTDQPTDGQGVSRSRINTKEILKERK